MGGPYDDDENDDGRRQLTVVDSSGNRHRFLRGMVTHDLVKRGIDFTEAYAIAQRLRDALEDRDEVTTAELRAQLEELLEDRFGEDLAAELRQPWSGQPTLRVLYDGRDVPFSRGVLAGSIYAAGVDRERAYELVTELEADLRAEGMTTISNPDLVRRVDDLLESRESRGTAARYRMIRRIPRLPRPVVVFIGGGSGTGKSHLALELAPLLRIYRVIATDTIRQVMRMVFTPAILPALHRSTFEIGLAAETPGLDDTLSSQGPAEVNDLLIANFDEQATRVMVGVRAVVERAIAENMSIIVEGVHLRPGLVPFPDLEAAAYQVPILLGTVDREAHRARFLHRSPSGEREAARYLDSFDAIRTVHDYLLNLGDTHETPYLDTYADENAPVHALRIISSNLERRVPALGRSDWIATRPSSPTLLLIVDGLPDRPVRALGGRTPLQAAATPTLDRLAREGRTGLADPIAPGVVPDTAAGTLALFGQSPQALKRGPVEALGAGIELAPGDVALRGNFATLDDTGNVIDRRAGRIRDEADELVKALQEIRLPADLDREVQVLVQPATEHRLAVVLRGDSLSPYIRGSDPGDGAVPGPALTPRPLDPGDERAVFTARVLGLFEQSARQVLAEHPVNERRRAAGQPAASTILTRGAGRVHRLMTLEEAGLPLRICCVSGDRTVLGLARWLGARLHTSPEMTANLDTDLDAKLAATEEALDHHDLVFLHVKGADIAAHDRRPELKVQFLERLDRALGEMLERWGDRPLRVAVASDHATISESGQHAADPLPVLLWGEGIVADSVERFDEQSVAGGGLHRFPLQMLLGRLFELS